MNTMRIQPTRVRWYMMLLALGFLIPASLKASPNTKELLLNQTINPTIITLSDPTAGSVRAQLLALGYDPDQLTVSLVIAIGDGRMISLTDQQAEGNGNPAQWKGLTIVNPQARFTLRSGTLVLNDANVHLRGSFHYEGYWSEPDPSNRTRLLAGSRGLDGRAALSESFLNNQGGYLVFDGPTSAGADIVFSGDGANSTVDGFVLRRLRLSRSQGLSILDNGGTSPGSVPSALVVSEKLEILGKVQPGDNHIKWIGGNDRPNSGSIPEQRFVRIDTEELSGTGYFWLANQDQGADPNTITINGNDSGTRLLMSLRKSGSAGKSPTLSDRLVGITHIGNDSVSIIEQGWLQSGQSLQEISGDLRLGADRASGVTGSGTFELHNGVSITGNLLLADTNSQAINASLANRTSLILTTGSQDRKTIVKGAFHSAASASSGSGIIAGTSASTHAHDLVLEGAVRFGAEGATGAPGFNIARPSRLVLASAKDQVLDYLAGLGSVRIQRITLNSDAGYILGAGTILQVNDLHLAKGSLTTNGGLSMVDLKAGEADYQSGSLDNYSMVSRSSPEAYLKKGIFASAYVQDEYKADGGSPFSLQYLGTTSITTGDEVPFPIIGKGNIAYLERFVVDLASSAQLNMNTNVIILSRLEMLSGTVDIPFNNSLHLKGNALWVQGEGSFTSIAKSRFRFPDNSLNAAFKSNNKRYDLLFVPKNSRSAGFELSGFVRHMTLISSGNKNITLHIDQNKTITGTLRIVDGTLKVEDDSVLKIGFNLVIDGKHNGKGVSFGVNDTRVSDDISGNAGVSGWFPSRKGSDAALFPHGYHMGIHNDGNGKLDPMTGTLEFLGEANAYILGYVQENNKTVTLPHIIVNKSGDGDGSLLSFDINRSFPNAKDNDGINTIRLKAFTQRRGQTQLRSGNTNFEQNISLAQSSGAHLLETDIRDVPELQHWEVLGDMIVETGNFWAWGASMTVRGYYSQGDSYDATKAVFYGGQPTNKGSVGTPSLMFQVDGDFNVLLDLPVDKSNPSGNDVGLHRFYLANGWLGIRGNYRFFGHGDLSDEANPRGSGLLGTVEFNGTERQNVEHVQVTGAQPAAYKQQHGRGFFNNMTINNRMGIEIGGGSLAHMYLNNYGTLNLKLGNIHTGASELVLFNENLEKWNVNSLVGSKPDQAPAIINSGSNSFVQGNVRRIVSKGVQEQLSEDDNYVYYNFLGYAFPLGVRDGNRDYYRALSISFPVTLERSNSLLVSTSLSKSLDIRPDLVVPGSRGSVRLNVATQAVWNVEFEERPSVNPDIRIGAQGIISNPNANIEDMRIVARGNPNDTWRLFGKYNIYDSTNPVYYHGNNDWIDGIPTFWQDDVDFFSKVSTSPYTAEVRIATECGWNCHGGSGTVAYLQVIHNSPGGAVDLSVNDALFLDNFAYQTATSFIPVVADTPLYIALKTANGATELLNINGAVLETDRRYIFIILGGADGKPFEVKVIDYARSASTVSDALQFLFNNGVTNSPPITMIQVSVSHPNNQIGPNLATNAVYGSIGNYQTIPNPGFIKFNLLAGNTVICQSFFDLETYKGKTLTFLTVGRIGGTGSNSFNLIIVDSDGRIISSGWGCACSISYEECSLLSSDSDNRSRTPTEFTIHGNYPNPFNPTTNVRFDLPEQANVRVEVVDLLGRMVMKIAPQTMSAGANKVITIDASSLSTGIYFYRFIAEGQTRTYIQTSKFTLVK
jgi:hypothetical protein